MCILFTVQCQFILLFVSLITHIVKALTKEELDNTESKELIKNLTMKLIFS